MLAEIATPLGVRPPGDPQPAAALHKKAAKNAKSSAEITSISTHLLKVTFDLVQAFLH
jgi:hypothetical protein